MMKIHLKKGISIAVNIMFYNEVAFPQGTVLRAVRLMGANCATCA